LLLRGHVLQGAEVVQAVRQLDDDDAHVLRHGDEHLAEVLGPLLLPLEVGELVELADLGLPLHDAAHGGPKRLSSSSPATPQSSMVSWRRPAATVSASMRKEARISATATGWVM
jgi:hypothetical protein